MIGYFKKKIYFWGSNSLVAVSKSGLGA